MELFTIEGKKIEMKISQSECQNKKTDEVLGSGCSQTNGISEIL